MSNILVEHDPSPMKLEVLGVEDWAVRVEEAGRFEKRYLRTETCYVIRGRAEIVDEGGEKVVIGEGDLVTFLGGSFCRWDVLEVVERFYSEG